MNYDIRFRAWRSVLFGVLVMLAGVAGASFSSPWWLLMLPIGATSMFRLERNVAAATLAKLERDGLPVVTIQNRFYGVAHGRFCRGSVTGPDVKCFVEGTGTPTADAAGAAPGRGRKPAAEWLSLAIDDIASVHSSSGENTIRFDLRNRVEEMALPSAGERDEVLKVLRPACPWTVVTAKRKVFRISPGSWLACLPLMLFSVTIVLTSIGIVQPHQLPLVDWNDIGRVRGKGRGLAVLGVLASQAYRFVVEQWPPVVAGGVGVVGAIAFGVLLVILQWTWLTDETWTHPRPPGAGD